MQRSPIVVLVGGTSTHKSKFYSHFTKGYYTYPTTRVKCGVTIIMPSIVLVDTPGLVEYRTVDGYSWDTIFKDANLIVNFGNWSVSEIYGILPSNPPPVISGSEDLDITMKQIADKLQECFPSYRSL